MYHLLHYELIGLLGIASFFGLFGLLPFSPFNIIFSACFFVACCWSTNKIFSRLFHAPINSESAYITALILSLIVTPVSNIRDIPIFILISCFAMGSKYILAIQKKHLFNPAAIAVVASLLVLKQGAGWWVGDSLLTPFVLLFGIILIRKVQRWTVVGIFFVTSTLAVAFSTQSWNIEFFLNFFLNTPILFFGFFMLTEPITSPVFQKMQVVYALLVGILYNLSLGGFYLLPEYALLIGNVFSYIVNPKQRLLLTLKEKISIGESEIDFIFTLSQKLQFIPGQYMEWTLPHANVDGRGNRRYFTIASSPTEDTIRIGTKFASSGSSFKKSLANFSSRDTIVASQLSGEFTLPKDAKKKLVFLAGGIGITPFRSMVKYIIDTKEKRDIVLLYSNKVESEIMYKDIFDSAGILGVKTIYTLTGEDTIQKNWKGERGRVTGQMIRENIPDFPERFFYLSGPHNMVDEFEKTLKDMGISSSHIKKDFFPGFA